ncbi:MAG TPA: DUF92 domain-containing protein [Terracidiphilus sp.]|nr:DUF92 domain-containing protein [Terracidiphilus sp.]
MTRPELAWQSKAILLLVLPCTAEEIMLQAQDWLARDAHAAAWILGLSAALGLLAWAARSGTLAASATGALITANVMFATAGQPFSPLHTALIPILVLLVMTSLATRYGRKRKERLGTAETRRGRVAAQVAANLGVAALVSTPIMEAGMANHLLLPYSPSFPLFTVALAALAEAAADTVSSEIGQVLGGWPVMLTTLKRVEAGTDGAISMAGTLAGVLAAGVVSGAGVLALGGGLAMLAVSWAGGVFGLFFDSLLGATLERRGWLNNDAVNFLSTLSAAAFAAVMLMYFR